MGILSSLFKRKSPFNHEALIWETNTLSKSSLLPLLNEFPEFEGLTHPVIINAWDTLMTIAMSGVAAKNLGHLDNKSSLKELREALGKNVKNGDLLFDEYLNFCLERTDRVNVPWSVVSAMWITETLIHFPELSLELKAYLDEVKAVNILSSFMNMAYGNVAGGFSHFMNEMCLYIEKDSGIDMGFGTSGTIKDTNKKMMLLVDIFDRFAENSAMKIKVIYQ